MAGRLLVLGDIHGSYRALKQVFERSNLDYENDRVIFLGDVADGWPDTKECIDELLKVRNLVALRGNHDDWFLQWIRTGHKPYYWTQQGGYETQKSYNHFTENVPNSHIDYLKNTKMWHQEEDMIFVHGGWPMLDSHPMMCGPETLMWDRSLWKLAKIGQRLGKKQLTKFSAIFIGHTTTEKESLEPVKACEVWNLDQGCGWGGKLTLMDVNTLEYWQSDRSVELYPDHNGRFGRS